MIATGNEFALNGRRFIAPFPTTVRYVAGTLAIGADQFEDALAILGQEPAASPCYAMALGQMALAHLSLEDAPSAEAAARRALVEIGRHGCAHPPTRVLTVRILAQAMGDQPEKVSEAIDRMQEALSLADRLINQTLGFPIELELQKGHTHIAAGNLLLNLRSWPGARDHFEKAKSIYDKYPTLVGVRPHAHALVNLGLALTAVRLHLRAESVLQDALALAEEVQAQDVVTRSKIALIQLDSASVPTAERLPFLEQAAAAARDAGFLRAAHLRFCIAAEQAVKARNAAAGTDFVAAARAIEEQLPEPPVSAARLYRTEAQIAAVGGATAEVIVRMLIRGAWHWYQWFQKPLGIQEVAAVAVALHEHFLMQAGHLHAAGRVAEALLSFEAGRALGFSMGVDDSFFTDVLRENPFTEDGEGIDLAILNQTRACIPAGEVFVSLAELPDVLVGFVVSRDEVQVVSAPLPGASADAEAREELLRRIPQALAANDLIPELPAPVSLLAERVAQTVGKRTVTGLAPYGLLHLVPWRALLHHFGLAWERMPFVTGFGLFASAPDHVNLAARPVRALGHGHTGPGGTIDLRHEAQHFAAAFPAGEFVDPCTPAAVQNALCAEVIVLLSCHGNIGTDADEGHLILRIANDAGGDLMARADDVFPKDVCSPLVILSACHSGVYVMAWADYPIGAGPELLLRGAQYVIGSRREVNANFTDEFFERLGVHLRNGHPIGVCFARALGECDGHWQQWSDLACLELLGVR